MTEEKPEKPRRWLVTFRFGEQPGAPFHQAMIEAATADEAADRAMEFAVLPPTITQGPDEIIVISQSGGVAVVCPVEAESDAQIAETVEVAPVDRQA